MLKIYELKDKGLLSVKIYNALSRGIWWRGDDEALTERVTEEDGFSYRRIKATVDELFDYYGEDILRAFRCIGSKSIEDLKALRSIT